MIMTEKERTRFREQNICNLAYGEYWSGNDYGIPEMLPTEIEGLESINLKGFNYASNLKDNGVGIHFFLHDYQFERVWNKPELYAKSLKRFRFVLTPDFSHITICHAVYRYIMCIGTDGAEGIGKSKA